MCCDPRRNVRHMAISYLQRALLAHDLQRLSPNEWEACFLEVRGTFWGGEGGTLAWERGTQDGGGGMLEGGRVLCRGVYRSSPPSPAGVLPHVEPFAGRSGTDGCCQP